MQPRNVLLRLVAPFAGMIVLIVLVCGGVVYLAGQRALQRQQIRDLDRLTALVRQWLDPATQQITDEQIERVRQAAEVLETRITLIEGGGRVLLDSHIDPREMVNHNDRPEVRDARAGHFATAVRFSQTFGEQTTYVARLLDPARPDGIVVRLSYPRTAWQKFATPAWAIVGGAVLTALIVMGFLAWLLQRRWIGPVEALWTAAARMADGRWDTRVEPRGADEVKRFSERLNELAAKAQKQLAELDTQRSDLRALVDSLPDPILLTDSARRIVLINAPAARLLGVPASEATGRNILDVVNDEAVLVLFEALHTQPGRMQQRELRLTRNGQRLIFHAVATRTKAAGALLVLRNISAMAAAVQMKTDFVANASHELRTPISAIKIAFETLQDVYTEDPLQSARCISVIAGHLRRLEQMLGDLLDLSRVESAEIKPNIAPVRASELLDGVRSTMGPAAREKGVELVLGDGSAEHIRFDSDKRLLDLILRNLVENSIKYTPAGGTVTVKVRQDQTADARGARQHAIVLSVEDSGIGIPPEHMDRVFERFYQVDSARSGSAGRGTGLGLAIVKHATSALGGDVDLRSAVGVGTTVTCTFPVRDSAVLVDDLVERT